MAIIDNYTKEELEQIVQQSNSLSEVIDKLGYGTHNGGNSNTIKKRLEELNIDYSHFKYVKGIERNEDNVFIKDSTACQTVLRRWYLKGQYTPYECSICGLQAEWQGKPLTLILDHIDGSNHNNVLSNLRWVCPNCNQQLETTGFKQMRSRSKQELQEIKKYYCISCGKEVSRGSERCPECAALASRVVERPSRETLKSMIRTLPFTQIAKEYGVTDNTIRKWCDSYNLPRLVKEIKKYNDKDWELL